MTVRGGMRRSGSRARRGSAASPASAGPMRVMGHDRHSQEGAFSRKIVLLLSKYLFVLTQA